MFGLINLNKPHGLTSHQCVAKIRRLLNLKKVGHGGTLDPLATGVLPIAVGKATRLLPFLPTTKAYRARIRLGVTTTTDDLEGEVIENQPTNHLNSETITHALKQFQGEIVQTPPIYSAIKKNGQKMYELARKGINTEVPSRIVTIDHLEVKEISFGDFLEIDVAITCGSGTYIRAIARDLGQTLGVGGTLANLVRTQSCGMSLNRSLNFTDLATQISRQNPVLIEPATLLTHLPPVFLPSSDADKWLQGQIMPLNDEIEANMLITTNNEYYRTYRLDNQHFLGISILVQGESKILVKPKIVCINVVKSDNKTVEQ